MNPPQKKKISHVHEEMFNRKVNEMSMRSVHNLQPRIAKLSSNLSQIAAMCCHLVVTVQSGLNINNSRTQDWLKPPGQWQQFQEFPS